MATQLRAYPKRGLALWRRVDFIGFFALVGEGQTPFRIGSWFPQCELRAFA